MQRFSDFNQTALFSLDLSLSLLVGLFLSLESLQVLLMLILLPLEPALGIAILHTRLVDKLIATTRVLNGVLPLQIELVTLLMQPFEFLGGLIQFDLGGLSLSHFLLELIGLTGNLNS